MEEELEKHLLNHVTLNCCLSTYRHVTCLGKLSPSRMKWRTLISLHDNEVGVYASLSFSVHNGLLRVGNLFFKVGNIKTNRIDDMHL